MITGVVLARNEEKNIVACLEKFRPHVDEIILIDMESQDRTVELASPWIDRTLTHRSVPNFDAVRNISIDVAKYGWLWFCDADERVSQEVGRAVRDLVRDRGHEFEALTIPFKTYFCGKWIEHCGWWPGYTMPRVMKRGYFRFREQLHGGVQVDGRELRFTADPRLGIDHFSYASVAHYFDKFNRYTSTEAQQLADRGETWDWRVATQAMVRDLWLYYERNQGRADGAHGWILSWLSGQYRWASQAKLLDVANRPPAPEAACPADLDEFFQEARNELSRLREGDSAVPTTVVWRTPLEDPSGYAEEGRCFTQALAQGRKSLRLETIRWSDRTVALDPKDQALYRALQAVPRPSRFIAVTNCIPTLVEPVPGAALNILRTTFETDRLPSDWLPRLAAFDEIWVISNYNRESFIRSGVAAEKIRVIPSCLDTDLFRPDGPRRELPPRCTERYVFLSIFDWQRRKGWDVLLQAYVREFSLADDTTLLLKINRQHGQTLEMIRRQAAEALAAAQTSLEHRPDILFFDELLDGPGMAALYRSVDAFVLPSRGEGWGRPYMEAMACGLPTIGTAASGNIDFMSEENSLLVPATSVPVSEQAAQEISVFRDHRWYEPDEGALRKQLRRLRTDSEFGRRLGQSAAAAVRNRFDISAARKNLEAALAAAEARFIQQPTAPRAPDALRIELQGEFLSGHSFSNINEYLAQEFFGDPELDITLTPRFPVGSEALRNNPRGTRLKPHLGRALTDGAQVVIRHAYPPDWSDVPLGKWVHIQPWEFGWLPLNWIEPLRNRVDEIWAPSHYVKRVYERSGIPSEKIHVIPWGVDPTYFNKDAVAQLLPTKKSFRFVYVGGTVARKGFDLLLEAYLAEFRRDEDVSLVIKDVGVETVYRYGNYRRQIFEAMDRPNAAEIVYYEGEMTPGQLASLYAACHCLAAPYRGEGFGLPILEAMACGIPPIVPRGGPTDDFVDDSCGYVIESREVQVQHPEPLCGPPTELEVSIENLRRSLRKAFEQRLRTDELGRAAAERVRDRYIWASTAALMKQRLQALVRPAAALELPAAVDDREKLQVTVIMTDVVDGLQLADTLARTVPFASQVFVEHEETAGVIAEIAQEYGADVTCRSDGGTKIPGDEPYWLRLSAGDKPTEQDWARVKDALADDDATEMPIDRKNQPAWTLHARRDGSVNGVTKTNSAGLLDFRKTFWPHLDRRASTFLAMLKYLEARTAGERRIVETGCVRMPDDWGAGQSTLIFDRYVDLSGGRFQSIDNSPQNADFARRRCRSSSTTILCEDSIRALNRLATETPQSIDLLYLDSYDVDWANPHPSALHHLNELCAARRALKPGALVVVDDHRGPEGCPGKSLYVADFLRSIQAQLLFEDYQIGWIVP